jgi:hypothetical protein
MTSGIAKTTESKKRLACLSGLAAIAFILCGCASTEPEEPPPSLPVQVSGTELDPYNMAKVRSPESLHAYYLGPYVDPQDSGIRHDGHRIARVEQSARWNLSPSAPTAVPLGPVVAVADPAQQVGQLSGELESKITQANSLIAALIEQNDVLQDQLAERDKAIADLSRRLTELEQD